MDTVINPFASLALPKNAEVEVSSDILFITKWNWDYLDCLTFQKNAQKFIQDKRHLKVYIFCNHPACFTLGRGNERGRENLIDFDSAKAEHLKFPIHKIHRGGGITFHYPGQWIFYPIVAINQNYSLETHMCWLLKTVKEILKSDFNQEQVLAAKKLMGVWIDRKKVASIGVGLNRFVTEHGIALNLIYDKEVFTEVMKINPCGMSSETYISLDQLIPVNSKNLIEQFHQKYIQAL